MDFRVALVALLLPCIFASVDKVDFQLRSANDLNEWTQLLAKGVKYFHVDLWYRNETECLAQDWYFDLNRRGCLVLSKELPQMSVPQQNHYNLIDHLSEGYLQSTYFSSPVANLVVNLCFHTNRFNVCDSSRGSNDFRSLLDDMASTLQSVKAGVSLDFIFDCDASFTPEKSCLLDLWRPINYPYHASADLVSFMNGKNPAGPFYNAAIEDGSDRLLMLTDGDNMTVWRRSAQAGWGKFVNSIYPALFTDIPTGTRLNEYGAFLRSADTPDMKTNSFASFVFSGDMDPTMFHVYSASFNDKAAQQQLAPNGRKPRVSVLSVEGKLVTALSLFYLPADGWTWTLVQFNAPLKNDGMRYLSSGTLEHAPSNSVYSFVTLPTTVSDIYDVIACNSLALCTYSKVNTVTNALTFESMFVLPIPPAIGSVTAVAAVQNPSNGYPVLMSVRSDPTAMKVGQCLLWAQVWNVIQYSEKVSDLIATHKTLQFCVHTITANNVDDTEVTDIAVVMLNNMDETTECMNQWSRIAFVEFSTSKGNIYGGALCVDFRRGHATALVGYKVGGIPNYHKEALTFSLLDVGQHPQLSIIPLERAFGHGPYLLEVHDSGFCWTTSASVANSSMPKCTQSSTSQPGVLTYNVGTLTQWLTDIKIGKKRSPCGQVYHGNYDLGTLPSAALFLYEEQDEPKVGIVEMHEGFTGTAIPGQCAAPVVFDGTTVDSWLLPTVWDVTYVFSDIAVSAEGTVGETVWAALLWFGFTGATAYAWYSKYRATKF
eukprot:GILJ01003174.1.p1 GENE.GILJ01003174.1~~GILJ01003174.1.p1  ORF type:complete len:768 (-),score=97.14 GILJ01003174.1:175-2478(-)